MGEGVRGDAGKEREEAGEGMDMGKKKGEETQWEGRKGCTRGEEGKRGKASKKRDTR